MTHTGNTVGLVKIEQRGRSPGTEGNKPAEAVEAEPEKQPSAYPKCGMPLPCRVNGFDAIDALRCPNCDALFEQEKFVCVLLVEHGTAAKDYWAV